MFIRDIQYSDFVEIFNCLTALESNVGAMTVRTVLKVPFEKAALPLALPTFRHPWLYGEVRTGVLSQRNDMEMVSVNTVAIPLQNCFGVIVNKA